MSRMDWWVMDRRTDCCCVRLVRRVRREVCSSDFMLIGVILGAGAGRLSWQWAIDNPPVLEEEQSFSRNIHWIRYFLSRIIKMLSFSFVILAFLARFI
jgi:hypothetical protein